MAGVADRSSGLVTVTMAIHRYLRAAILLAAGVSSTAAMAASTLETSTLALLDQLQDREMPDVMLWVIERAVADPGMSADARSRLEFLKGSALVAASRTEATMEARSTLLDEAEASINAFLATSPSEDLAIAAFTQKGNLLVERGRLCLARADRPGSDVPALRSQAVGFFDSAIATLQAGDAKQPRVPPVTSEDAILVALHAADAEIEKIRLPIKELREQVESRKSETDEFQKQINEIDGEILQKRSAIVAAQAELAKLQTPPQRGQRPTPPQELQTRFQKITGDIQGLMAEITKLEQSKAKPTAEIKKAGYQRSRMARELASAEKPLEADLAEPLRRQEELRTKLLQTRLMVAETYFEKSKAYEPESKEWKQAIEASRERNHELAEKYGKLGVGFVARLNEGRNLALLGKRDAALATLAPLFTLDAAPGEPLSPLGLSLKTRALGIALECWLADKRYGEVTGPSPFEPEKYRSNAFLRFALAPAKDGLSADLARVKYRTAEILAARAADLGDKETATAKLIKADAVRLARDVANANGEFAKEARSLAGSLGKEFGDVAADFPTAASDAQAAFTAFQEARTHAGADTAAESVVTARDAALKATHQAVTLGEADTTADEATLNQVRTIRAFLLHEAGEHADAAALGRMLVEKYPNAPGSRQAARVALASLQSLAASADPAAVAQAHAALREVASLMVQRWPLDPEGADAMAVLIGLAAADHDVAALASLEAMIPAEQPRRAELLLRLGTALRHEAVEAPKSGRSDGERDQANTVATRLLDEGLAGVAAAGRLPEGPSGAKVAFTAALARVQMALEAGDTTRAAQILDDPVIGPWRLVASGSDPTFRQGSLAIAALSASLTAFVELGRFDDVQAAMRLLDEATRDDPSASDRVAAISLSLGRSLQKRLDQLSGSTDAATRQQAATLVEGLEAFLQAVAARDPRTSAQVWVATTYQSLGAGAGKAVPQAKADGYLDRAAEAYAGLLDRLANAATPEAETAELRRFEPTIRLKLAGLSRERSRFDVAQQQIDAILAADATKAWLDAQEEAARLLLDAGRAATKAGDKERADGLLREAAVGRQPTIWGWSTIANRLARQAFAGEDPKALEARRRFFEARLNVAEALVLRAELGTGADREKRLATAESAITMTHKLYPDLGGDVMRRKFDALLKTVQSALGRPANGLDTTASEKTP